MNCQHLQNIRVPWEWHRKHVVHRWHLWQALEICHPSQSRMLRTGFSMAAACRFSFVHTSHDDQEPPLTTSIATMQMPRTRPRTTSSTWPLWRRAWSRCT